MPLLFGTTNNAIHTNSMSEFETSPTLLYFQLLSSYNLSQPLRRVPFSLSLMLVILFILLHLAQVLVLPPSPNFVPRSILAFKSLLEAVYQSFLLPTLDMLNILLPLDKLKMLSKLPKHLSISQISLSLPVLFALT